MTIGSTSTKRRTLLQRGFALLAGGTALAGGARWVSASSRPAALPPTLTLYARTRPVVGPPGAGGQHHASEGRIVASGELLDGPDGQRVGTFHTNCFCLQSPFGPQPIASSNLEFHVLELKDGTLFAVGSGSETTDAALAIIGGTSRYAGRSGAYTQRAIAGSAVGDDVRQLIVTFAG